jgi:hypothetical protein
MFVRTWPLDLWTLGYLNILGLLEVSVVWALQSICAHLAAAHSETN